MQRPSKPFMPNSWRKTLKDRLPTFGHRNWIAVVDAAYPLQVSRGVEMVLAHARLVPVLRTVLLEISRSPHIAPRAFLDAELSRVSETHAHGIGPVRLEIHDALAGSPSCELPHSELLTQIDNASRSYCVLVIKTCELLPYTSVFLELGCKYSTDASERSLRREMANRQKSSRTL